jgi:hypothetical protein
MPSLHAKIKQQRGGFRDFFEVGVGKHRLEIGVKRGPARPSRSRVTRVASDDNAGGELMAAKVRPPGLMLLYAPTPACWAAFPHDEAASE